MRRIDLYVFRQLVLAVLVVTVVLCLFLMLMTVLRFVDDIADRGMDLELLAILAGLSLPQMLTVMLPFGLFIAILFVYHRLATDSELVAMRAVGCSDVRLATPALGLTLATMAAVSWINLSVAPWSESLFREILWQYREHYSTLLIRPGSFRRIADRMTLYVRDRSGEGEYAGLLLQDDRDPGRRVTYMAERGVFGRGEGGPRLIAVEGSRHEVDNGTGQLTMVYFDRYAIDMRLSEESERYRNQRERPLRELLDPPAAEIGEGNVGKYKAEGHYRIASGLFPGAVAAVMLACLFIGDLSPRGYLVRSLLAVLLGLGVFVASLAAKALVIGRPSLAPLLYLTGVLPMAASAAAVAVAGRARIRVRSAT